LSGTVRSGGHALGDLAPGLRHRHEPALDSDCTL